MKNNNSSSIDFANFNYEYFEFQQKYRLLCQEISEMGLESFAMINNNPIKKTSALIKEYRVYVKNIDMKKYFDSAILDLLDDVDSNEEYKKLISLKNKNHYDQVEYNKHYYNYLIRLFEIIGKFGDELSATFMPTKSDRKKLFKYQNTNNFFEQFTKYKTSASKSLAEFSIYEFRKGFVYFIGFYFAYYLFIDFESRNICEKSLSNVINIYLSEKVSSKLSEGLKHMSVDERNLIKKIDRLFHNSLTSVFSRMNVSYSEYGVIPKIEEKIDFDYTLI